MEKYLGKKNPISYHLFFIKFLSFFILMFYLNPFLYSQNRGGIKGSVKDSSTRESIPYALIMIEGTKLGTSADANGFYKLQDIPFGEYNVIINAVGYKKSIKKINLIKEDPILINILLAPQPVELKGVVKIVDRMKELYRTNISVQSISQEELKILPITVEKDLLRAVKVIPGISSTGDVTSQFYVRGGGGDQNLILLDNMMIYNPYHAFGLFSIFNADAVKISEVFTGGIGPEYGGRLSSVINIITKEGNKNKYSANVNFGLLSGQGLFEGPLWDGSFFVAFRKSYFNNILKKFIHKDLPLSFYDFSGKLSYPLSEEGKIQFNTLLSNDELLSSKLSEPDYYWDNNSIGFCLQTFLDKYFVNVSFSSSSFKAKIDYKNYQGKKNATSGINDFFFNSRIELPVWKNDLLHFGLSFLFPKMEYSFVNNSGYYIERSGDEKEINFFTKYEFTQIENLIASIGMRLNFAYLSKTQYAFEPRIGLKYQLFPFLSVKGSYGKYHQAMFTTFNEDDIIPLFESWMPVKSSDAPETNNEYIAGIDVSPFNFLNVTFQGYYRKYDNLYSYNLNKRYETDPDFASGTGKAYGIETSLKFQDESVYGWLNYSWSWSNRKIGRTIFHPRFDKRHVINVLLSIKLPFNIDGNLYWEISSGNPFTPVNAYYDRIEMEGIRENSYIYENGDLYASMGKKNSARLPWYHRMDLSFSKTIMLFDLFKAKLNLDIINLYDHKNIFYFDKYNGQSIYMLPFLPSFSINIEI